MPVAVGASTWPPKAPVTSAHGGRGTALEPGPAATRQHVPGACPATGEDICVNSSWPPLVSAVPQRPELDSHPSVGPRLGSPALSQR